MMLSVFLVLLLLTALGSTVLYLRTGHDIFQVLAAGTALVCLIWGLVIAHWTIHLLSLVVLLKFKAPVMRLARVQIKD